jgi:hypothetical protein
VENGFYYRSKYLLSYDTEVMSLIVIEWPIIRDWKSKKCNTRDKTDKWIPVSTGDYEDEGTYILHWIVVVDTGIDS